MDIENFKLRVRRKKKGLGEFLDKLDHIVPVDMPVLVAETDAAVWRDINCTTCANCCKAMTPTFRKPDIIRIAAHLQMKPKDFTARWLKKDDAGDWVNVSQPCQFLAKDKCSIYEVRPRDCAEFPHHNKLPFDAYNETYKNNLVHCPATFTLVERLKKAVERGYEW